MARHSILIQSIQSIQSNVVEIETPGEAHSISMTTRLLESLKVAAEIIAAPVIIVLAIFVPLVISLLLLAVLMIVDGIL